MNTAKLHIGGITGVVLAFFMCLASAAFRAMRRKKDSPPQL